MHRLGLSPHAAGTLAAFAGGEASSPADSLVQYLLSALYPSGLTREIQILLGLLVLAVNLAIYGWLWRRTSMKTTRGAK